MNIKQQIEEWKKVKQEISPWPWIPEKNSGIYPNESTMPPVAFEVYNTFDHSFIAAAPQNYDQAMQALEEASRIMNGAMSSDWTGEREASKEDAKEWIRKWGFQ